MSFSSNSAESSALVEWIFLFSCAATLFWLARYGHRLGASLRDEPGVPRVALYGFEAVGWIVSLSSGLILAFVLAHIAPLFFLVGLSSWIYPCLGTAWIVGLVTLGPLVFAWLRHEGRSACVLPRLRSF